MAAEGHEFAKSMFGHDSLSQRESLSVGWPTQEVFRLEFDPSWEHCIWGSVSCLHICTVYVIQSWQTLPAWAKLPAEWHCRPGTAESLAKHDAWSQEHPSPKYSHSVIDGICAGSALQVPNPGAWHATVLPQHDAACTVIQHEVGNL